MTVLITGSTRGVGRECALYFAKKGYKVAVNSAHDEKALRETVDEIRQYTQCEGYFANVGNAKETKDMCESVMGRFGGIDILINNAAVSYVGLFTDMSLSEWDEILSVNLSSLFFTCRCVVPHMVMQKRGKIINISSVWGRVGASCEVAYSAAKGGVDSFTRALARELAPSNIQVNAVALGVVDTKMNGFLSNEEREQLIGEIPAGRMADPKEAAEFIYNVANAGDYLTAQVLTFDGGWT